MAAPARRYRGLDAGERRAERRARLIAAGIRRFGTAGLRTTTVKQICSDAAMSTSHFYQEFSGRQELFWAVHGEVAGDAIASVLKVLDDLPEELDSAVRLASRRILEVVLADEARAAILIREFPVATVATRGDLATFAPYVTGQELAASFAQAARTRRSDILSDEEMLLAAKAALCAAQAVVEHWLVTPTDERVARDVLADLVGHIASAAFAWEPRRRIERAEQRG
jgi:AcrR family transcriptional regulator